MHRHSFLFLPLAVLLVAASVFGHSHSESDELLFIKAFVSTKEQRTAIAEAGMAMDGILSDSVIIIGDEEDVAALDKLGISHEVSELPQRKRDFPGSDSSFHNHNETLAALNELATAHPQLVTRISLGKSLEGREIAGVRISSKPQFDSLPTALFMGCHHAREHLSVEVPLMLAQYLVQNYNTETRIRALLDSTEVWVVPMVNPDGAEYDIANGSYRMWRKNRSKNSNGTYGVDLNRNYGSHWGGPGSSGSPSSDTYRGPAAFSEPETQAVRDFVRARKKATVLLTYHTFSELILWPWGWTDEEIGDANHRKVFETMGKKMAGWNGYTPQKSSELYLASGDTTDWAYDELKIFAFTFELSPRSMFSGGFYPGASAIEPTFKANLEPALYLISHASNPLEVVN